MLHEGTHTYSTAHGDVKYRYRQGRSDRRHLLVIFSGFRHKGTLDFGGSAIDSIQHNVLWIYDEFGDPAENSYYLMQGGQYDPRDAVQGFLHEVASWQGLDIADMTFAGFSKGGSAALYHGLEMGAGAVISTVPQFAIGSYVQKNWPAVFDRMRQGTDADTAQKTLDQLLPGVLASSRQSNTNVYLFSAEADHQFAEEIEPNLEALRRLRFFNFVMIDSPLITQHIEVTPYNVPGLLALFQLCADKLYPYLGEVQQTVETNPVAVERQRAAAEGLAVFEKASVQGDRVELELTTLIRGVAQSNWGATDRELLLKGSAGQSRLALGKKMDASLSRKYLKDTYIDYRAACSVSPRGAAFALDAFPLGKSVLEVAMTAKAYKVSVTAPVTSSRPVFFHAVSGSNLLVLQSEGERVTATRSDLSTMPANATAYLDVRELAITDQGALKLEAIFAPFGTTVTNWGDISYYLLLTGEQTYTYPLGMLDRASEVTGLGLPLNLRKAYCADIGGKGIDLSKAGVGEYDLHLVAVNADVQVKSEAIGRLSLANTGEDLPSVAVLGSCIVRDIFNSKFAPGWKQHNTLVAAAHQSALVSLTSPASSIAAESIEDLDAHSQQCVIEDFSKSIFKSLAASEPRYILIDLFSDARFGVAELADGALITNNSWKIGASKAYQQLDIKRTITLQKDEEEYLELFAQSLQKLRAAVSSCTVPPTFVVASVRAAQWLRAKNGAVSQQLAATEMLNAGFEKLENIVRRELPEAKILDLTEFTQWADAEHPWSAYVVHYEQGYYDALSEKMQELGGTHRAAAVTPL
ncbi:MAG: DUF6270 domain-containing protein [Rothia sp. (in: high G+C Gram-positive bacteria)]|nr:DUF6270 domain-containing protein [Rothia sp. (in: high G+C Gram-positive bacteria)]